jgi:threonine dehydrogenase-like Zn-dependent dehydrogenase
MAIAQSHSQMARAAKPGMMRAAVLVKPGRFEIQEVPIPEPGPGEVRIKLEGCGVCASNIPPFEGRDWFNYPMEPGALGHEGWGLLDSGFSLTNSENSAGSRYPDSEIRNRVAFLGSHSYAEYEVVPLEKVVLLPPSLADKPFPGEPLGCAMNIFRRSGVRAGDTVAILGIGFLGSILTQLCTGVGARVIAVARKPFALDTARRMGAEELVAMEDHNGVIESVKALTGGTFCDVTIECTGKQWPLDLAAELTKERGRMVIAGFHQDGLRTFNGFLWNWRGLDVINAHERDPQVYMDGIREAVQAVDSGRLRVDDLYTHRFHLDEIGEALTLTCERPDGFMKALIQMES